MFLNTSYKYFQTIHMSSYKHIPEPSFLQLKYLDKMPLLRYEHSFHFLTLKIKCANGVHFFLKHHKIIVTGVQSQKTSKFN